jgi:predicted ribosomally synthesized peptide with nif11-like leader
MSKEEIHRLVQRCRTDQEFRDKVMGCVRSEVQAAGFTLTDDEWAEFEETDWGRSDEQIVEMYRGPQRPS